MSEPHLLDPDLLTAGVPHERYAELRAREPVYWQERPGDAGYWALLKHEDVLAVSKDPLGFSSAVGGMHLEDQPDMLPTLLNIDPPQHTQIRRRVLHGFTPTRVRALEALMRRTIAATFERAAELRVCDFVTDLAAPLPLAVICEILGVPEADRERLGGWADRLAGQQDPEIGDLDGKSASEAALEMGSYAFGLGQARQGEAGQDLIRVLLRAEGDDEPTDLVTFSGLFVQIIIGGNETTRTLLCGGMLELLRSGSYRELADDPGRIPLAIEELLRWVTPVHYFRRTAMQDCEIRGQKIRKGDRVALLYAAANFDPEVFAEPLRFDVRRDPNPHVSFGFGEHFCIGARLARVEVRLFLEEFYRRFAHVELLAEPTRMRSNMLNSIKAMPVRLTPR